MFQRGLQQQYQPVPIYEARPPTPAAAPATDNMTTRLAQLRELGELKARGILTDDEFQAQKAKILGTG
jgi:hypothetical protein